MERGYVCREPPATRGKGLSSAERERGGAVRREGSVALGQRRKDGGSCATLALAGQVLAPVGAGVGAALAIVVVVVAARRPLRAEPEPAARGAGRHALAVAHGARDRCCGGRGGRRHVALTVEAVALPRVRAARHARAVHAADVTGAAVGPRDGAAAAARGVAGDASITARLHRTEARWGRARRARRPAGAVARAVPRRAARLALPVGRHAALARRRAHEVARRRPAALAITRVEARRRSGGRVAAALPPMGARQAVPAAHRRAAAGLDRGVDDGEGTDGHRDDDRGEQQR